MFRVSDMRCDSIRSNRGRSQAVDPKHGVGSAPGLKTSQVSSSETDASGLAATAMNFGAGLQRVAGARSTYQRPRFGLF